MSNRSCWLLFEQCMMQAMKEDCMEGFLGLHMHLGCARMRPRETRISPQQGARTTGGSGPSQGPKFWSQVYE